LVVYDTATENYKYSIILIEVFHLFLSILLIFIAEIFKFIIFSYAFFYFVTR